MERNTSARRLGPDVPAEALVVDTVIEHGRWGIVIRQYVRDNQITEGGLVHTHRRIMTKHGLPKEIDFDMVDHATGSMLQRARGSKQPLQITGSLDDVHKQLANHLGFPDPI